ncbi:cAMP-regulated D2 protein [Psilocybe cubensis]|uniref:cAMP-regulated D2 protein n=2 Tax=Psilocybe cubensis TaxID=181762 RepID=A0ACB8H7Q9_PSICU|nr:cAMP-regulated D2 protein [Psilocybe cubensis]KAH9483951.1 cAMP-regulated D2 protein [Psilocybe cubensis]
MRSFAFLALFAISSSVAAVPLQPLIVPPFDPSKILCQLPILKKYLCPLAGTAALNRATPLGTARGVADVDGAYRFPVRYASAPRWGPSTLVSSWDLPNGFTTPSSLPLACPQDGVDESAFSEDCLSMVLYVPPSLTLTSNAPILVWIHGGSFVVGSATGPGLDGSKLAIATDSIVIAVQYRLGVLGFMAPNGATNLAVKDVITALQFIKKIAPSFGGSSSKITLAGQSSGATMIRALLATPAASSLFKSAIIQSDPMNFGFLSSQTQATLQNFFNEQTGCASTDSNCLNAMSLDDVLDSQDALLNNAFGLDPSTGRNVPIRPVLDGSVINTPLDSTKPFPTVSKPVLLTTVTQEAAFAIYSAFTTPLPEQALIPVCDDTFGEERTDVVVSSPHYAVPPGVNGTFDARVQLQTIGTDYLWKCSGWTFARNWVQHGGTAYVGQFVVGASYPGNEAVPYCLTPGVVCHQDDIQIVFGTVPNPTSAQSALITEIQKRYKAFLNNGNPNAAGVATWSKATNSDVKAMVLGGTGQVAVGACSPNFWGDAVQYDYQFYNA